MVCNGCNTTLAARVKGWIDEATKKYMECCDICSKLGAVWLPDVYLGGPGGSVQTDPNLCNDKGEPVPFSTKREKAAVMNMLKVRQADSAEHQHGSRNEIKRRTYFT